jgi:hypothetical protein
MGNVAVGNTYPDSNIGSGEYGGDNSYEPPVHGVTADGQPVTASFGREGTSKEGHTLLSDGHVSSGNDFYGPNHGERHDHYGPGNGRNNNGTRRGQHTGYGA